MYLALSAHWAAEAPLIVTLNRDIRCCTVQEVLKAVLWYGSPVESYPLAYVTPMCHDSQI